MCVTSKQAKKQKDLREVVIDLVESLHLDERYPADDVAAKIEAVLEKAIEEAGIPDPDDFVEYADADRWLQENDVVRMDDIKGLAEKDDLEGLASTDDLEKCVMNDELDDALNTLNVVRSSHPSLLLAQRGFLGRVKWLLFGR